MYKNINLDFCVTYKHVDVVSKTEFPQLTGVGFGIYFLDSGTSNDNSLQVRQNKKQP